jgi:arginine exporter protein ArgO
VDTTTYKLLLLLHITAIVVAFSPAAAHTALIRQIGQDNAALRRFAGFASTNSQRIYGTSLILAGLFGIGLIFSSDSAWEFSQTWISLAFLVWIAMNGVLHAMIVPGERALGSGDQSAQQRLDLGGLVMTLLFLFMLYLMIWKPGL